MNEKTIRLTGLTELRKSTRASYQVCRQKIDAWNTWLLEFLDKSKDPLGLSSRSLIKDVLMLNLVLGFSIYGLAVGALWFGSAGVLKTNVQNWATQWSHDLDDLGIAIFEGVEEERYLRVENYVANFREITYVRYFNLKGEEVFSEGQSVLPRHSSPSILDKQIRASLLDIEPGKAHTPIAEEHDFGFTFRLITPIWTTFVSEDWLFKPEMAGDAAAAYNLPAGFVEIELDFSTYRNQMVKSIVIISGLIALLFIVASAITRWLLVRTLKPLTVVQNSMAKLASGDLNIDLEPSSHGEIQAIHDAMSKTVRTIIERDKTLERMEHRDALTGLLNRAAFKKLIDQEIQRLEEIHGTSALLFIDLDKFQYINDTVGRSVGDRLLIEASRLLRGRLRDNDLIARVGGNSFLILASDVNLEGATTLAHSLVHIMDKMCFTQSSHTLTIQSSIGITMIDDYDIETAEFFARADSACRYAKSTGGNQYQCYQPEMDDRKEIAKAVSWRQRISNALDKDLFALHFQPIVNLKTGTPDYYEVLVRMDDEEGGIIYPDSFLPAAEKFGLMAKLDYWVIEHAIAQLAEFRMRGDQVRFAINLSGRVLNDTNLIERVTYALKKNKVPAQAIIFEVTEQIAVSNIADTNILIRNLLELGCQFALDDFGTGFSSFSYLKELPVNYIKIDGGFVENILNDKTDLAMVRSMVDIAKATGKKTIAEYVQNDEVVKLLKTMGVHYGQGFYLGKPEPFIKEDSLKKTLNDSKK